MAKTKTTGAITQDKGRTWKIDTKIKINGKWEHLYKSGYKSLSSAKSDLERAKNQFIKEKEKDQVGVMFFEDLIREYKKMREITVNVTTLGCDESIYNVYLYPYFKGKLIKDCINTNSISEWYYNISKSPKYSYNKKTKIITRIKDILKFAYNHKYIDAQTYQDCDVLIYPIKSVKGAKKEKDIWNSNEEKEFLKFVKDNNLKDYILFKTLLETGVRIGELLGLQKSCYDSTTKKIIIKQQIVNIHNKGAVLTDILKTHDSYRTIQLPTGLCNILDDYIKTFKINDSDFLFFSNRKTKPISRTEVRRKLDYYCSCSGVKK